MSNWRRDRLFTPGRRESLVLTWVVRTLMISIIGGFLIGLVYGYKEGVREIKSSRSASEESENSPVQGRASSGATPPKSPSIKENLSDSDFKSETGKKGSTHAGEKVSAPPRKQGPLPPQIARIVIDKSDYTLTVYDSRGNALKSYPVAIGKNPDGKDKQGKGDNRTPEGDFEVSQIQDSSTWVHPEDGTPAAYGPWFIRLKTPWSGIGIHGTNEPEKIGTKASSGCVRMRNEDVEELCARVQVGTPVQIQP